MTKMKLETSVVGVMADMPMFRSLAVGVLEEKRQLAVQAVLSGQHTLQLGKCLILSNLEMLDLEYPSTLIENVDNPHDRTSCAGCPNRVPIMETFTDMNENPADVKINAPISETFLIGPFGSHTMHLVGLDRIECFLSSRDDCRTGDALKAFASEVAYRTWRDARSMARDFPTASFDALPSVAFHLKPCFIVVDCLIDFATGTVLIDSCKPDACRGVIHCKTPRETAARC
jgi:hypothetical protein